VTRREIVDWAAGVCEDLEFSAVRRWIEASGGKAIGYLPVYAPREIIRASGMLPVGIWGAGDLEIVRGDALYQSYICHIPRSVVELAQSGRLDPLSGMLFPATCDVIRNLSGVWKLLYPALYVRYLDLPQVAEAPLATAFWRGELATLARDLGELGGRPATDASLREAIEAFNRARALVRELYRVRREKPWSVPTEELSLLLRAGEVVPLEEFVARAGAYLSCVETEPGRVRDRARVIVVGAFCEQPPIGLIKTIERAGCFIVDDDFLLGNRLIAGDVEAGNDPLQSLAGAFVGSALETSTLYEPDPGGKKRLIRERAAAARADGVIFASASFCDPALLDRPMLRKGAEEAGIPCIAFQFAENTGQFQQFREQAGTFADSIKLWGGPA
jgi:benzoyl-CoA reductase subunit C